MNLKKLNHFQLVAEELNYHQAAEKANLSQPAISHSIKALEAEYGQLLFDRSSRSVSLTPFGEGVLEFANRLLFEASNFETGVQNLQSGASGHVTIGMVTTVAEVYGGKAISSYSRAHPQVSYEIAVDNSRRVLNRLRDGLDHFAICDAQTASLRQDVDVTVWGTQRGGFFCRPGHPILAHTEQNIELAYSYGLASLNVTPTIRKQLEKQLGIDGNIVPLMRLTGDHLKLCRDVCMTTDNILIAEVDNIQPDVDAGRLVKLSFDFGFERDLCIATKTDRLLPQAALNMIDYLTANQTSIFAD